VTSTIWADDGRSSESMFVRNVRCVLKAGFPFSFNARPKQARAGSFYFLYFRMMTMRFVALRPVKYNNR
jgi:hypothetical protein